MVLAAPEAQSRVTQALQCLPHPMPQLRDAATQPAGAGSRARTPPDLTPNCVNQTVPAPKTTICWLKVA